MVPVAHRYFGIHIINYSTNMMISHHLQSGLNFGTYYYNLFHERKLSFDFVYCDALLHLLHMAAELII